MFRLLSALLFLLATLPAQASLKNQLSDHPSPYLAMHGKDPVQWQTWGKEALARARAENKPLFISSGYFACHWCHVMQQESYQSPAVAALLNQYFIPVKVDRELQPALDAHLIDFVQRTRGQAGWPLNVFLTPEGYPLVGLTYSPTKPFTDLLEKLRKMWERQPDKLRAMALNAALEIAAEQAQAMNFETLDPYALNNALVTMALALGDEMEGGFGRQSRFPMAPQWSVLLKSPQAAEDGGLRELISLTLDQMANQGLRDHIGGGFFRYTVDPSWQVPHYEKMLYTQALLTRLYLQAADTLGRPQYREVARETLDFSLDVLKGEGGGFIASLSAVDPNNVEGGGYLWSDRQLQQALNAEELAFARKRWRLQGDAVTEGGYLPVNEYSVEELARESGRPVEQIRVLEEQIRQKLIKAREPRNHPRDDKQLAAWNGLMLSALVDGARSLGDARYVEAAAALRGYLVTRLWDGERLLRAREKERVLGSAALEDYVYVAAGLYDWGTFTGSQEDLALAGRLAREAWERFFRKRGWQGSDDLLLPGIATEPVISDGPLPSPAALLIGLSLKLDDPELRRQARQALNIGQSELKEQPIWYATQVQALVDAAPTIPAQPMGGPNSSIETITD